MMAGNIRRLLFFALLLIVVTTDIRGLPDRFTPVQSYTLRKILSKGNYVPSRSDGKIIFPTDDMDLQPSRPQLIPNQRASCPNSTFCEDPDNYPNDIVEAALRMNKEIKFLSRVDVVPDIVHRLNTPDEETPLCETYEKVVYPKVAQSKDKEWLFVVNQGDFTQGVRIETCGNENNACNLIDGFAEGYKTSCKQKYIYRQLVAVSPMGELKPEMFRFPASCCCHIRFTGNPLLRIGANSKKKSGLPV